MKHLLPAAPDSRLPRLIKRAATWILVAAPLTVLTLWGCSSAAPTSSTTASAGEEQRVAPDTDEDTDEVNSISLLGDDVRVIVVLKDEHPILGKKGAQRALRRAELLARAEGYAKTKRTVVDGLVSDDLSVEKDFDHLPILRMRLKSQDALDRLRADERVVRILKDSKLKRSDLQSFPLIRQPEAVAKGFNGSGTSVAVLDSGVDYTEQAFGSCTAPGLPAELCRVTVSKDFAAEDNTRDDTIRHGTNVAGIVSGLAPGTNILALDVFDGDFAYTSVIVDAINWVIANRDTYSIASMNLSLGGGRYYRECDLNPMAVALQQAREAGVLAAVASGNEGHTDSMSAPGCAPAAVSVGAVYDKDYGFANWGDCTDSTTGADKVVCFANVPNFLKVLAPGVSITAAGITMSGTSQATPHVAATIAVLRSLYPEETPDLIEKRLISTGVSVVDARSGIAKPRIDVLAAASANFCEIKVTPGTLTAGPAAGSYSLELATGATCEWTLSYDATWLSVAETSRSGKGSVTLSVDVTAFDNGSAREAVLDFVSGSTSAKVTVKQAGDVTPPTGSVTVNGNATYTKSAAVTLSLSAQDTNGVSQMCISQTNTCSAWEPYQTSKALTLSATQGERTVYAWFRDTLGNTMTAPVADKIVFDSVAPTLGSIRSTSTVNSVTLSWTLATDATSGVAGYKLVYTRSSTAPAVGCTTGTVVPTTSAGRVTVTGLSRLTTYRFRLCARDNAGNIANGVVATVSTQWR